MSNTITNQYLRTQTPVDDAQAGNTPSASDIELRIMQDIEQLLADLSVATANGDFDTSSGNTGSGGGGGFGSGTSNFQAPAFNLGSTSGTTGGATTPATTGTTNAPVTGNSGTPNGQSGSPQQTGSVIALSTAPQTTALTPEQSKQTADAYVSNLQHDFGLTRDQAAGIVANLWHESGGMNSGINQGGAIGAPSSNMADDNGNGYGIAQWGGSRKQGLIDYAHEHGLDPSSQAANYGYLKQELETSESGAISAVKSTNSAQAATVAFCDVFEKPSDPEMASRLDHLSEILA